MPKRDVYLSRESMAFDANKKEIVYSLVEVAAKEHDIRLQDMIKHYMFGHGFFGVRQHTI